MVHGVFLLQMFVSCLGLSVEEKLLFLMSLGCRAASQQWKVPAVHATGHIPGEVLAGARHKASLAIGASVAPDFVLFSGAETCFSPAPQLQEPIGRTMSPNPHLGITFRKDSAATLAPPKPQGASKHPQNPQPCTGVTGTLPLCLLLSVGLIQSVAPHQQLGGPRAPGAMHSPGSVSPACFPRSPGVSDPVCTAVQQPQGPCVGGWKLVLCGNGCHSPPARSGTVFLRCHCPRGCCCWLQPGPCGYGFYHFPWLGARGDAGNLHGEPILNMG